MDNYFHAFDTACGDNYSIAKKAADKAGMYIRADYRANCIKCYHFEITANSPEQVAVLDLITLATTAHAEQPIYKQKLIDYIYKRSK